MKKWDLLCSRHTALEKGTQITNLSYCLKILIIDCTDNKIVSQEKKLQHRQVRHKRLSKLRRYYQIQHLKNKIRKIYQICHYLRLFQPLIKHVWEYSQYVIF